MEQVCRQLHGSVKYCRFINNPSYFFFFFFLPVFEKKCTLAFAQQKIITEKGQRLLLWPVRLVLVSSVCLIRCLDVRPVAMTER